MTLSLSPATAQYHSFFLQGPVFELAFHTFCFHLLISHLLHKQLQCKVTNSLFKCHLCSETFSKPLNLQYRPTLIGNSDLLHSWAFSCPSPDLSVSIALLPKHAMCLSLLTPSASSNKNVSSMRAGTFVDLLYANLMSINICQVNK